MQTNKIVLSDRMQTIVSMLLAETDSGAPVSCAADIGCDHAFVSMACVEQGAAERMIAADVRRGPLRIAQDNIRDYGFEKSVETRLSDGFSNIKPGEISWAILAGMGGALMRRLLRAGEAHLRIGIGLLVQPQSEPELVRTCLTDYGYRIEDERFIQENGKFYTIIKAKKSAGRSVDIPMLTQTEAVYGPVLLQKGEPLYRLWLEEQRRKMTDIRAGLTGQSTEAAQQRCAELTQEISLLEDALACMRKTRCDC